MTPTPRLAALLLLGAGVCALAAVWQVEEQALLTLLVLLVPVAVDLLFLRRRPAPRVERPGLITAALRRPFALHLRVHDAVGKLEVAVAWPPELGAALPPRRLVAHGESEEIALSGVPKQRGVHAAGDVWLRLESPLGLWAHRVVDRGMSPVSVWPDLKGPGDDLVGRELEGEGTTLTWGLRQAGSDLRGLRPFQGGDDPRHVDWKATARAGSPVVREWQPDKRRVVMMAIDAGRLMRAEHDGESKFDAALRALGRLALAAEARGDQVGALVFTDRVLRFVPPLSGAGQCERLLRYLSDLKPRSVESDLTRALPQLLAVGRRSLVVVVSDVLDQAAAASLTAAVVELRVRHAAVVALLRDPHLDEAFARRIEDTPALYRRVAAELVAHDRHLALDGLRARGIWAFDLSMRALAFRLVQAYLDARAQARW